MQDETYPYALLVASVLASGCADEATKSGLAADRSGQNLSSQEVQTLCSAMDFSGDAAQGAAAVLCLTVYAVAATCNLQPATCNLREFEACVADVTPQLQCTQVPHLSGCTATVAEIERCFDLSMAELARFKGTTCQSPQALKTLRLEPGPAVPRNRRQVSCDVCEVRSI